MPPLQLTSPAAARQSPDGSICATERNTNRASTELTPPTQLTSPSSCPAGGVGVGPAPHGPSRQRTKTSGIPLVSPVIRLLAFDPKTTKPPSWLMSGAELNALPWLPALSTL